jgi:TonB-linked outer membrane protein, SusC/RagA family
MTSTLWGATCIRRLLLTFIITLICLYTLNAQATHQPGKSITLKATDVSLYTVFKAIRKQTNIQVAFNSTIIDDREKVSVNFKNTSVEEVMAFLLQGKNLNWVLDKDRIVITRREEATKKNITPEKSTGDTSLFYPVFNGRVTDAAGTPIGRATVQVKGTLQGTTTDNEGKFSLEDVKHGAVLLFSSVGYETRELKVTGKSGQVYLMLDIQNLEETVVKGYYNTTKRENTGNVSTVKAEEIRKQPVSDPLAALIGRVPGLQVTQLSGAPGRAFNVQIRGRNSIGNGSSPLFIVDGVPFFNNTTTSRSTSTIDNSNVTRGAGLETSPLNSINPNDIESIEILKDADATAIYGSRGANGVILITTKKGQAGKTKVSANVYHGMGRVTRKIPLLNTQDYLMIRREGYKNDGVTNYPSRAYDINGKWDTSRYTDWQKIFIGGTSHTTDAQTSISGGTANTQFLLGLGYHRENTIFPGDYSSWRGSAHYNVNHQSHNGKFGLNFSGMYSYSKSELPLQDFVSLIQLAPNAPKLYNEDGSLNWESSTWINPMSLTYQKNTSKIKYLNANLGLNYKIVPGLQLKATIGYSTTNVNQLETTASKSFDPSMPSGQSFSVFGTNDISIWNFEPQVQYKNTWGIVEIDWLLGTSFMQQLQQGKTFKGTGYTSDDLLNNFQSASVISALGDSYSKYKYNAIFSRLNFNIDRKYFINLTTRRDGSSRFGPGRQFASFGALGAAWIFSDNDYFREHFNFLSFGKLRGSYGITGNDQIGDYQFLDTYQPYSSDFTYLGTVGLQPTRLLNTEYAWEVNKKLEGAIELGFLRNRILLDISYYRNRSSNQLLVQPLASQAGFGAVVKNLNAVVQNTGWEIQVNSTNIRRNNFSWESSFNVSIPKNELIEYPGLESSPDAFSYVVGQPLNIRQVLKYTGIDTQSGLYQFFDQDKDGNIAFPNDYQTIIFTGQQYFGGLRNDFRFHGFELSFFFQFVRQKKVPNYANLFSRPGTIGNKPTYILDRWTQPADNADVQKIGNDFQAVMAFSNFLQSDGVYSDGSLIRLKTISCSYTLNFKNNFAVNSIRVYANAQNILTFTGYKGLDPESKTLLPPLRVISAGIQVDL